MLAKVEKYCTSLLSSTNIKKLPFHNLLHTQEVVQNAKFLCKEMHISRTDKELLLMAAWFHDTGFIETYSGHEEISKKLATEFLRGIGLEKPSIQVVTDCIDATIIPQSPTSQLQEILCDADVYHTSNLNFYYRKLLLRREWELFCDLKKSDKEWHELNLVFLKNLHFKTSYGKRVLEGGKQENIEKVEQILRYYE
ncbi:MAG TPA: HD domain-containing protein [Flavobacteriaceae bacterium]|jgi:predicted metal-dependent HD superfamily phosphohydrolase|nr:HD domain-containing protein [Flavobacteriaceae bacterium]HIN97843.1 HD domain-containing protein [Flavobacteriaceae bacterium]|tara:strand:- start:87354 stop:87941 length:588 start_codon:yes stop_codon:yes gene_type:complete